MNRTAAFAALKDQLRLLEAAKQESEREKQAQRDLLTETICRTKQESALLPSVVAWADRIQKAIDERIVEGLIDKARPAIKAAEEVKEARALARKFRAEAKVLLNHLNLYEAEAPWLVESVDCSLADIL